MLITIAAPQLTPTGHSCKLRHCAEAKCQLQVPTRSCWARETKVGVATGRRPAALRPAPSFTLINTTRVSPKLERFVVVIIFWH
jgi:hypothetical protein